jgi:hypothetical protein
MKAVTRLVVLVIAGVMLSTTFVSAAGKPQPATSLRDTALAATISGNPLAITVYDDTSIGYTLEGREMVFGTHDSGSFLTIDGKVYGPTPLANQGIAPMAYTPVGNTLSGTGTSADPYTIVTTVDAGSTGVRLIQTLTYVEGEQDYSIRFRVENTGAARTVRLIHASDLYVNFPDNELDYGYAFYDPATGSIGSVTKTGQFVQAFLPNNDAPPSAFQVSNWGQPEEPLPPFWTYISDGGGLAGSGLQNIVQQGYYDIVCGFQWDLALPPSTNSASPAAMAAGVREVGMRGAFGPASRFNVRPFAAFLPLVSAP